MSRFCTRDVPEAKSYRVTLDSAGRWHIAFAAIPDQMAGPKDGSVVGIDRGVTITLALSNGATHQAPTPRIEKASTSIARTYDLIRIEDLRVATMTRSARGTTDEPGRNVRAKAGLNRSILAGGWSVFAVRLEQKAPGRIEKVNPAFSSQRCSACGHIARESRESQALFRCVACGHTRNADLNAARNIAAGHVVTARGGLPLGGPVNREPQHASSRVAWLESLPFQGREDVKSRSSR